MSGVIPAGPSDPAAAGSGDTAMMDQSSQSAGRPGFRGCVVITPSADATHWRAVVTEATLAVGLKLVAIDTGLPFETFDDGVVYLTNNPELGKPLHPTHWVAIMSRPNTGGGTDTPTLIHASGLMAAVALLPPDKVVLTDRELIGSLEPIVLFDRIQIAHKHAPLTLWEVQFSGASQALAVFDDGLPRPGARAQWLPEIFSYDLKGRAENAIDGKLDLSGRARYIVFGPYLWLTPGVWRATATFSVDEPASWRRFRIEWGPSAHFAEMLVEPGKPGVYRVELTHRWMVPAPAELKFILNESALSGHFEFLGAEIEMVGTTDDIGDQTEADAAAW